MTQPPADLPAPLSLAPEEGAAGPPAVPALPESLDRSRPMVWRVVALAWPAWGQQFLILMPDGRLHVLPEYPGDFRWRTPNVNATLVTLGQWHRIEWYCQLSTGTLKWWLDGVLQGSYTDVRNSHSFDMFQFSPTWGGNSGARKRETDHYWFDHVHLSVR